MSRALVEQNKPLDLSRVQEVTVQAARAVGALLRDNQLSVKRTKMVTQHDIKLELDVRSQRLIEGILHAVFPSIPFLGEEGITGDMSAPWRWVIDPIDGTVNYTYGIPHVCISIALQNRAPSKREADYEDGYRTMAGVVYDPFCDELWTAIRGKPARLNGRVTRVSRRSKLSETIISIGFSKTMENLNQTLPYFTHLAHRVRKIRMMGSAALALTYVASGRFDAYIETGIRLWDIAAGGLILECAGGEFSHKAISGEYAYRMITSNGLLRKQLQVPAHIR